MKNQKGIGIRYRKKNLTPNETTSQLYLFSFRLSSLSIAKDYLLVLDSDHCPIMPLFHFYIIFRLIMFELKRAAGTLTIPCIVGSKLDPAVQS